MSKQFDVIVIGGGPGGYIAAIRAAQLGFNVACIDEWKNAEGRSCARWYLHQRGLHSFQGACCNHPSTSTMPTTTLPSMALTVKGVSMDVAKMIARKNSVVKQNNDGILYLLKKNKIAFFHGRGSFVKAAEGGYDIKVAGAAEEVITGKQVIVATGSNARALPGTPFDEVNVLSNDGALNIGAVPKKIGPDRLRRDRSGNGLGLEASGF